MNDRFSKVRVNAVLALALAGAVSACAPWGKEPEKISIGSVPPEAEIFVMGEKVGVTPMAVDLSAIFPVAYAPEKQALYGAVELRKPGCRNSTNAITTQTISKGLRVTLECEGAAPAGSTATKSATIVDAPPKADVEARLRKVRELREKGLISEQEEQAARQRILHEL